MAFFGKFYNSRSPLLGDMDPLLGGRRGDVWTPAADIFETDEGVVILVELPGVAAEDIELHVEAETLLIRGARREVCPHCKKSYRQMELRYGPFERVLPLPCPVKEGKAALCEGILEIFLPRARKRLPGVLVVQIEMTNRTGD